MCHGSDFVGSSGICCFFGTETGPLQGFCAAEVVSMLYDSTGPSSCL